MNPSLLLCLWAAPALASPSYATRQVRLELERPDAEELRALVGGALQRTGVSALRLGGEAVELESLSAPQLGAALATLTGGEPGIEYDLILPGPQGSLLPITVWWEPASTLTLAQGPPVRGAVVAPAELDALRALGVGPLVEDDRSWTPAARGLVHQAWSLLTEEERRLLGDITLHRRSAPTDAELAAVGRGPGSSLEAIYQEDNTGGRIVVFDGAMAPSTLFTGEVDAPRVATVLTLLHEMAHALAASPGRQARARFLSLTTTLEQDIAAYNAAVERYNALAAARDPAAAGLGERLAGLEQQLDERSRAQMEAARQVDVLIAQDTATAAAFAQATGGLQVTWYATASLDEAFAEAFSLARADPEALRRISPQALDWFERRGHLHSR